MLPLRGLHTAVTGKFPFSYFLTFPRNLCFLFSFNLLNRYLREIRKYNLYIWELNNSKLPVQIVEQLFNIQFLRKSLLLN